MFDFKQKEKKKLPEGYKKAKMGILQELSDMASGAMGDDLKGLKKVTVASNSPKGLEEGLEKAQDMLDAKKEDMHKMPDGNNMPNEEMFNPEEHKMDEEDEEGNPEEEDVMMAQSPEDIQKEIDELMMKKMKLMYKKG